MISFVNLYRAIILLIIITHVYGLQEKNYPQLIPINETSIDSSFVQFKVEFLDLLKNRDSIEIYNLINDDIIVGFDEEGVGKKEFTKRWKLYDPNSEFWAISQKIIELGCVKIKEGKAEMFACPYVYANFPDSLDAISHVVVINKNVNIFEEPSVDSKVIMKVDYAILKISYGAPEGWVKVRKLPGQPKEKKGYLLAGNVYKPASIRILFTKIDNKWEISSFVGGD